MSDYTQITDFSTKDGLTTGDPEKIVLGADFDGEFTALSTAIASKYDSNDIASEAQAEAGALDTVLITPLQLFNVMGDNGGMVEDIQALNDPGNDTVLGWDDTASAVIGFTLGNGLEFSGTELQLEATTAGYGLSYSSGVLALDGSEITLATIASGDKVLFGDITASDGVRYATWANLQLDISITESQVSDLGSYYESGDSPTFATITTTGDIELGHASDTTVERLSAAQLGVEGKAVLQHAGSYTSGQVTESTSAPSGGADGDIWLVREA